jgi:4-amino-4-deoxy-L-arabinose transferase-like glycosyltransferase
LALLLVIAIFGLSVAGLAVHGPVGGILLLIVAAVLVTLSVGTWGRVRPHGRPVRVLIAAMILGLAIAKLLHRL